MTWSLLLPAAAVVISLAVLAGSFRRVDRELVDLRLALRRSRATAVATDDLQRLTTAVATQAADIEREARTRVHRRRNRRRSEHR